MNTWQISSRICTAKPKTFTSRGCTIIHTTDHPVAEMHTGFTTITREVFYVINSEQDIKKAGTCAGFFIL